MIEVLESFDLSVWVWILSVMCGVFVGMAKTGISGLGMLIVPVLAAIFGGKPSVGILLPMLCVGDIFAVKYYHRHAEWKHVLRLLPWAITGIIIGVAVGNYISDIRFKQIIAAIILISIPFMIWRERQSNQVAIPNYRWITAIAGLAGGFATMIGNAAGPIMAIYLLSMQLPKNSFIGTAAWFFMIVNLLKIPLHVFIWHTITIRTLSFDFIMIPAIAAGALLGVGIVKIIPEKPYRIFIIIMTIAASFKLFF